MSEYPINIFLDTNIFEQYQFDTENERLKCLRKLADDGRVAIFIHKLIVVECHKHIQKFVRQYIKELKNIDFTKIRVSKKLIKGAGFDVTIHPSDYENKLNEYIVSRFDRYLESVNYIQSDNVDIDKIISLYANNSYPFEVEKQDEFKDAIVIESIKSRFLRENAIIVSMDNGFRKSFEGNRMINTYPSLDKILEIIASEEADYNLFKQNIILDELKRVIEGKICDSIYREDIIVRADYNDGYGTEFEDYEIVEIIPIGNVNTKIYDIAGTKAKISYSLDVGIDLTGWCNDYERGIWDSEDRVYYWLPQITIHDSYSVNVRCDLEATYHANSEEHFEFELISIENNIVLDESCRIKRVVEERNEDDWYGV